MGGPSVIKENTRDTDFLGRWGGEEFIIVCPETDLPGAHVMAEKLRRRIEEFNFSIVKRKTASFGVASLTPEDDEVSLIRKADESLYFAKNNGRNRVGK